MARVKGKKTRIEVVTEEGTAVEMPGAPVVVEEAQPEAEMPFSIGEWHGHARFACNLCPWDTLEGEAAFWEHWQARHAPPAPPAPMIQVYDAGGRPVER